MTFLGVDCGTSGLKAVLVDDDERILGASTQNYRPANPHPLWSEQNPDDWRDAMFAAMAALAREAPAAMRAVAAIGFSGQMHSAVLLDEADRPLRPAILHNDTRAFAEARELAERHPELAAITGVKPMAGFTAPKLIWLRRHEPEAFARIRCILLPKDYLRFCLTSEKRTDMSDAAGTWWLDEARRQWSPAALDASGVDIALMPPLVEGSQAAGLLRDEIADRFGMPRRIIVAAGGGDAAVGALGIGAVRPGASFVSLGTSVQLIVASDRYSPAPELLVHSFAHALPARWYRMAAMLNGAGALAFVARLLGSSPAELEREAAQDYRGPGELLCLPYLSGERTPHDDPHARGVFFGLSHATTRVDLARATMEGVALTLVDARDCVESGAARIGAVGLIGGGAKSALWTRMIASALERTVVRYRDGETGPAFGAARLARLAATGEAPEDLCKAPDIADVTEPDPALAAAFKPRIERFRSLYRALKSEFAAG
ncbi:xylulokinase [Methylocapsa sp. S129]|uniref:xylulokinase n=1 Tax=Methylocapsa sp. S129 TaxID=1641869 RepID=UPI00131DD3D7|nr:xylulokinase [Methylocapsa sp. S129]